MGIKGRFVNDVKRNSSILLVKASWICGFQTRRKQELRSSPSCTVEHTHTAFRDPIWFPRHFTQFGFHTLMPCLFPHSV